MSASATSKQRSPSETAAAIRNLADHLMGNERRDAEDDQDDQDEASNRAAAAPVRGRDGMLGPRPPPGGVRFDQQARANNHKKAAAAAPRTMTDKLIYHGPQLLKMTGLGLLAGLAYGAMRVMAVESGAICELKVPNEYVAQHPQLGPLFAQLEQYSRHAPEKFAIAVKAADSLLKLDSQLCSKNRTPALVLGAQQLAVSYEMQCVGAIYHLRNSVGRGDDHGHIEDLLNGGRRAPALDAPLGSAAGEEPGGIVGALRIYTVRVAEMTDHVRTF